MGPVGCRALNVAAKASWRGKTGTSVGAVVTVHVELASIPPSRFGRPWGAGGAVGVRRGSALGPLRDASKVLAGARCPVLGRKTLRTARQSSEIELSTQEEIVIHQNRTD
jgi:hypothetical protein